MAITDWMNRYGIVKNAVKKLIKEKSEATLCFDEACFIIENKRKL